MQQDTAFWLSRYERLGYSFFNTKSHEKRVNERWTIFQERKPDVLQIRQWLKLPTQNYAIVCGEISNLVVFDVDTKNGGDPTPFLNRGLFEIRTPSGGYHFYTLYDPVFKSTKHKRADHKGILHAVDVQSNGALVFCPPSKFPNLPEYTITNDVPVTPLPDDLLVQVLESLTPEESIQDYKPYVPPTNAESRRPGDIFNKLATWDDVLIPLGWTKVGSNRTGTQYWKRPGKTTEGVSASTNYKGYDLFFPYTTSIDNLTQKRGYTKFSLYTTLVHNGDPRASARALVYENYKIATQRV
jgi:hypothetical protein